MANWGLILELVRLAAASMDLLTRAMQQLRISLATDASKQLREKWTSLSGKLKLGGAEVSKKVTTGMSTMSEKMKELAVMSTVSDKMKELAGMSSVGDKMKELFRGSTATDKLVEELTSEDILLSGHQQGPDWPRILALCNAVNRNEFSTQEIVRSLKKRLMFRSEGSAGDVHASIDTIARTQILTLILIEALVKNCENVLVEISNQHVLDEMVKIVDDPTTAIITRDKTLKLIEAWGESAPHLRNLPMFEETYKSLKSRGVKFPLRDPESLAPIFTPQSRQTASHQFSLSEEDILLGTYEGLARSQIDEILQTARNTIDLLSTVLTSSPKEEAQDDLIKTIAEQCRQSHAAVQRVAEQVANDEALLFEILNVNDELQKVISKYEEMHSAVPPDSKSESQPAAASSTVNENQSNANPEGAATAVSDNVS